MKKGRPGFNIGTVRTLAAIGLTALLAFGVVSLAIGVMPEATQSTGVVWSDQNFTNQHQLGRWLQARGNSYKSWAKRHPSLASLFEAPDSRVATQPKTHRRHLLLGALATGLALLLLAAVRSPWRYRRPRWTAGRLLTYETVTPAFAAMRASASFVAQAGSASSPYLRSAARAGRQSIFDMQDALSTPEGRRTARVVMLYSGYAIFAIALGASVAIYFP